MVFSSTVFLFLFLPAVLALYYNPVFKGRVFRNGVLLLASLGFYAWGEPLFVFVMMLSVTANWLLVLGMEKVGASDAGRRRFCVAAIVLDVGLLFVFKYASFAAHNVNWLLKRDAFTLDIALPVGISFFTFQIMSYVLDVYWRKVAAQKNLASAMLYVGMFPQLIAGPIVRYETVAKEIDGRRETSEDFCSGMARFVVGLGKKLFIANYAGFVADRIFELAGGTAHISAASAWLGALAYSLQIYFDFSAYSDMAIGLGRMFGFHFLENFNYPYAAHSITDFWRRWHISLSTWFRDYVYIPLGGNRVSRPRLFGNLLAVWLLTGVWHGANWTFVAWGLFYFSLLALERLFAVERRFAGAGRPARFFCRVCTLFFVMAGWVLFRSASVADPGRYLAAMFGAGSAGPVDGAFFEYFSNGKWLLLAGVVLSAPVAPLVRRWLQRLGARAYWASSSLALVALFTLSVLACIKAGYNPFIYFNF